MIVRWGWRWRSQRIIQECLHVPTLVFADAQIVSVAIFSLLPDVPVHSCLWQSWPFQRQLSLPIFPDLLICWPLSFQGLHPAAVYNGACFSAADIGMFASLCLLWPWNLKKWSQTYIQISYNQTLKNVNVRSVTMVSTLLVTEETV